MAHFISSSTIDVVPHPSARDQAVAKIHIKAGTTILKVPAFSTALLFSQKGHRCDHCLRLPDQNSRLRRCTGCLEYWYCGSQCQNAQWQAHHRRICRKFNQFTTSTTFQGLEEHAKMDAILLTHLLARLSTLSEPYSQEHSKEMNIFMSLLEGPSIDANPPPTCAINPTPPPNLIRNLFNRFGNNNFTVHSHFNTVTHAVFPLASRLFNHSCVPNAGPKYTFAQGEYPTMEVVALADIEAGEQISIPYLDPALTQTRHQIFQYTYGFTCTCPACTFLSSIGELPAIPSHAERLKDLSQKLRDFVRVDVYLTSEDYCRRSIQDVPKELYPVLNETYMNTLSEMFSEASHEGNHAVSADSGITLLALYLLVYPNNYPQIGMHLLEMAKTHWNCEFVLSQPSSSGRRLELKRELSRLLVLARRVLGVMGAEGDTDGPFQEIALLESLVKNA